MNKKKILLTVLTCFGVILLMLFYLNTFEYSLSDISPDNYTSKLTRKNSSIIEAGLQDFVPDSFPILESYGSLTSDNYQNNGLKITNIINDETNQVDIHIYRTNINYTLVFREGRLIYAWIFEQGYMDPNTPPTFLLKSMTNNLIFRL